MSEPADELLEALNEMRESGEVSMADDETVEPEPEGEPEEEIAATEEVEEEDAGEEAEEAEDEETEEEEEEDQGEPGEVSALSFSTDDPTVLAYLARYDNDPSKALKAAVDLQRVLNRQGQEKNQAVARVAELEAELAQARAFDTGPGFLSEEQQEFVENAIGSGQPQQWIQAAVREQEFGLARAIVDEWANDAPVQAIRASQMIDHLEAQALQPAQPEGYDRNELLGILVQHYPDMPKYDVPMKMAMGNLGENHPLVLGAKSPDPEEAARSIVGLYEIAKASSVTVSSTRAKVKKATKDAAVAARDAAVVTSGSASPNHSQTPRTSEMIVPGLSVDDLSAAMAEHQ